MPGPQQETSGEARSKTIDHRDLPATNCSKQAWDAKHGICAKHHWVAKGRVHSTDNYIHATRPRYGVLKHPLTRREQVTTFDEGELTMVSQVCVLKMR